MQLRAASADDLPSIVAVQHAWETACFGAPEQSVAEVAEVFDRGTVTCLVTVGDRPVGWASRERVGSTVVAVPDVSGVHQLLLAWLESHRAHEIEAFAEDAALIDALEGRDWQRVLSAFDLQRIVDGSWRPEPARWPEGVQVRPFTPADAPALHRLVYVDAAWTDSPGHHARPFDEWHDLFLAGREDAELPVLACASADRQRLVGAAVLRHFADGTGWVAQLAVARDHRRRGLATALLAESFDRLAADGARTLGLNVSATNRGALELYLRAGLEVSREWITFHRADVDPPRQFDVGQAGGS